MAVLKPNLNWTTIQDKQLKALESLNSICSKDFDINKDIQETVEKIPDIIFQSTGVLLNGIDAIWNSRDFHRFTDSLERNSRDLGDIIEKSSREESDRLLEAIEDLDEHLQEPPEDNLGDSIDRLEKVLSLFESEIWKNASKEADNWSSLYNDTIRYIGVGEDEAQEFRKTVIDEVMGINQQLGGIGGKLDPRESMATMLAISQTTNISNMRTLEALTRPIILAQESTNVNIHELAKLGARLYTRYSFTSDSLESLVDHIRNTAEGKDVSEDAMLRAADMLEPFLGNYYKDKSIIESSLKDITTAQAYLESSYIDSSMYLEDIKTVLSGNAAEANIALRKYGDVDGILSLINSGSLTDAVELMVQGIAERSVYHAGLFEGLSTEDIIAAQNLFMNDGPTMSEFIESIDDSNQAWQRTSEKYVSIEEQVYNKLSEATSYLATIQENLGVGMSDVTLGASVLTNLLTTIRGTGGGAIAGGKGLAGLLMTSGPAIGIAAGVAALAVTTAGILESYKKVNKEQIESWGDLGTGDSFGDNTEFIWKQHKDAEGNISWSSEAVDTTNFSEEQLKKFREDQELNNSAYLSYIKSGKGLGFWGTIWDAMTSGSILTDRPGYGVHTDSRLDMYEQQNRLDELSDGIYRDVISYYLKEGLLDLSSEKQIEGFLDNIDYYHDLFEEGRLDNMTKRGKPKGEIHAYAEGTNYVPSDQLAYIHKGESITPAEYNPANNMNELERLRAEKSDTSLSEVLSALVEIRNFMEYWKTDKDRKDAISESKTMLSRMDQSTSLLSRYNT